MTAKLLPARARVSTALMQAAQTPFKRADDEDTDKPKKRKKMGALATQLQNATGRF